ncbi:UDP-N-acetylglucosamine 2-epimerase, partial [Pseudoalteromonas sp. 45-MNA-CIBAN-0466]
ITLREETEWVELVEHNFNVLVGADKTRIITTFAEHTFSNDFNIDLYGNGFASNNIATALINYEK